MQSGPSTCSAFFSYRIGNSSVFLHFFPSPLRSIHLMLRGTPSQIDFATVLGHHVGGVNDLLGTPCWWNE